MRSQETRSLELRSKQLNSLETRDSVREVMMVAERDTLREVTTISLDRKSVV